MLIEDAKKLGLWPPKEESAKEIKVDNSTVTMKTEIPTTTETAAPAEAVAGDDQTGTSVPAPAKKAGRRRS